MTRDVFKKIRIGSVIDRPGKDLNVLVVGKTSRGLTYLYYHEGMRTASVKCSNYIDMWTDFEIIKE